MLVYDITSEKSFENIKNWIRNIEEVTKKKSRYIDFVCYVFIYLTHLLKNHISFDCTFQHASSDVEKMILGNKCDMNDRRQVSKERGEKVRSLTSYKFLQYSTQIDIIKLIIYKE